jgi:type I restriction enzyme R subunit
MATGTGKTRTAAALMDVLIRARWAKRLLFLVDRIALRDQALDTFKEHLPAEPRWPLSDEKAFARDRRIYVTTYPTMLNMIQNGTTPETWISPHFFDVLIADESHRSIYDTYRQVIDYFSALKLGLTATPKDQVDFDTFNIFNCPVHEPTYAYSYEEAITHDPPYLTDFEVLNVRTKYQLEGIKAGELPPEVQDILAAEGRDLEDIDFEGTDLERKVTNAGTNALILREFMEECIKDSFGTLPGKTIIFAMSKGHARRLQQIFDRLYPEHKGKLARVLVSEDRFVHGKGGLLDQFKTQDLPRIAISVDMLDTGVDVREVVNLVFAKPVFSYVKFWQMIGRGTRVLVEDPAKRRPWCTAKDKFLIIDCWGNFEFFKMTPKGKEPGQQKPLPVRLFEARLDKLEAAFAQNRPDSASSAIAGLRADLGELPANNVVIKDHQEELDRAAEDSFWAHLQGDDVIWLRSAVAPVFRTRSDADFKAMRFETEVVEFSTAVLNDDFDSTAALEQSIVTQILELPLSVNVVARHKEFIEEALRPEWWQTPTEEKLADLVSRLAPLMRFRERRRDPIMKLNIKDLVMVKEWIEFGPEHERLSTSAYRDKVEAYVRELLADNPVLQKIQAGETVTGEELDDLARLLESSDAHVTEDLLRKVYDHRSAHFLQFIRHILGLEKLDSWPSTVTRAFDDFISAHTTLTALQIRFLQTLRTFILQTGKVRREDLIDAPFTQLHPDGIRGIFPPAGIQEILTMVDGLAA